MLAAGVVGFGAGMLLGALINNGNNNWGYQLVRRQCGLQPQCLGLQFQFRAVDVMDTARGRLSRLPPGLSRIPATPDIAPGILVIRVIGLATPVIGGRPGYPGGRPGYPGGVRAIPARSLRIGPTWPETTEYKTAELSQARHASQPAQFCGSPGASPIWPVTGPAAMVGENRPGGNPARTGRVATSAAIVRAELCWQPARSGNSGRQSTRR